MVAKGDILTEKQKETITRLEQMFRKGPDRLEKDKIGVKAVFFAESRIKGLESVEFIHSYTVAPDGRILDKNVKTRERRAKLKLPKKPL